MAGTPDDPRLDLLQGTLDMLVLRIETGSLYPALHRLEKRGWLKADKG